MSNANFESNKTAVPTGTKETKEKQEQSIDRDYLNQSRSRLNSDKEDWRSANVSLDEGSEIDLYFADLQKTSHALAFYKKVQPTESAALLAHFATGMVNNYETPSSHLTADELAEREKKGKEADNLFTKTYEKALGSEGPKLPEKNLKLAIELLYKSSQENPVFGAIHARLESARVMVEEAGSIKDFFQQVPGGFKSELISLLNYLEDASMEARKRLNDGEIAQDEFEKLQQGVQHAIEGAYFLRQLESQRQKMERAGEQTKSRQRTTQEAEKEDNEKISETRESIQNSTWEQDALKKRAAKKDIRKEKKEAFSNQLKEIQKLSDICYKAADIVQPKSSLQKLLPFTKSKKQFETLMILAAETGSAHLPKFYEDKTEEEMNQATQILKEKVRKTLEEFGIKPEE